MEDKEIVALFFERREQAIEEVSKKYHPFCFGIAWNLLHSREDSEECVNDTWFAAWRYIPPKRPDCLPPFLGKITRGLAIDRLRKKYTAKRADACVLSLTQETEDLNLAVIHHLDEGILARELLGTINQFLAGLKARERDIFIRRYWFMDPIKEIAKRHRTTQGAVKQSLFRTRQGLLRTLEKEGIV